MAALLSMKNIKKSFSGVAALKNAELELNKGEVLALMGGKRCREIHSHEDFNGNLRKG